MATTTKAPRAKKKGRETPARAPRARRNREKLFQAGMMAGLAEARAAALQMIKDAQEKDAATAATASDTKPAAPARTIAAWATARIEATCEVKAVAPGCALAGVDLTGSIEREFQQDGGYEESLVIRVPGSHAESGDDEIDIRLERWDDGSLAALIDLLMALRMANAARDGVR